MKPVYANIQSRQHIHDEVSKTTHIYTHLGEDCQTSQHTRYSPSPRGPHLLLPKRSSFIGSILPTNKIPYPTSQRQNQSYQSPCPEERRREMNSHGASLAALIGRERPKKKIALIPPPPLFTSQSVIVEGRSLRGLGKKKGQREEEGGGGGGQLITYCRQTISPLFLFSSNNIFSDFLP